MLVRFFTKKQRPNIVRYRDYHNFDNEIFISDMKNDITQEYSENQFLKFESFKRKIDCILEKHAPLKKRYVRANQAPFIVKNI